jgi:hypothetical protein
LNTLLATNGLHNLHGVLRSESRFAQTASLFCAPLTLRRKPGQVDAGLGSVIQNIFSQHFILPT